MANLVAGVVFAFPSSPLGQLVGLPLVVAPLYRATVALFVLTFGGAYAWLARQPQIDRPMVALAAIGKLGFFTVTFLLWLFAAVPAQVTLLASGDLLFAALFLRWLMGH